MKNRDRGVAGQAYVEKEATTQAGAITEALVEMGLTSDEVRIDVIEEEPKGLFKIFSKKKAKIRVYRKENIEQVARKFLEDVFADMKLVVKIDINLGESKSGEKNLDILLSGDSMGLLIGKRGQTLDSLQYLLSLVVNKSASTYVRVKLDTENYRNKRKETLEKLAFGVANKAKKTGRKQFLEPMNPNDRRIIHSSLQSFSGVSTSSEGSEPFRKVVIIPDGYVNKKSSNSNNYNRNNKRNNNKNNNYRRNNNKGNGRNNNKNFKRKQNISSEE